MLVIQKAADLIRSARCIVAFTGAGLSTASGIPDFRSPQSGLWKAIDPIQVASLTGFRQNPQVFFDWIQPLIKPIIAAKPNEAHQALAYLEQQGKLTAIITQNIDRLHQLAGNNNVHELHGHLKTATCTHCFKKYDASPLLERFQRTGCLPRCNCQPHGSIIKPDVILFGEQLPYQTVRNARQALKHVDLLIVAGSSLRVEPANQVPLAAIQNGAKVIIINYEPTPADDIASLVIHNDVNVILPGIVRELEASV